LLSETPLVKVLGEATEVRKLKVSGMMMMMMTMMMMMMMESKEP